MKTVAVFLSLVAVSMAGLLPPQRNARLAGPAFHAVTHHAAAAPAGAGVYVVQETPSDNIGLDGYRFAYQLSDGSARDESARYEARGPEEGVLRVQGSYSYVDPADGQTYTIQYIADENGFQPQGAHLPVAPHA